MTIIFIIWVIVLLLSFSGIINVILSGFNEFFESNEAYIWLLIVVASIWIWYFLAFN